MIATPGRVLDLMEKKIAVMDKCKVLVLDEVMDVSDHFHRVLLKKPELFHTGRQITFSRLHGDAGPHHRVLAKQAPNSALFCHVPGHC